MVEGEAVSLGWGLCLRVCSAPASLSLHLGWVNVLPAPRGLTEGLAPDREVGGNGWRCLWGRGLPATPGPPHPSPAPGVGAADEASPAQCRVLGWEEPHGHFEGRVPAKAPRTHEAQPQSCGRS